MQNVVVVASQTIRAPILVREPSHEEETGTFDVTKVYIFCAGLQDPAATLPTIYKNLSVELYCSVVYFPYQRIVQIIIRVKRPAKYSDSQFN